MPSNFVKKIRLHKKSFLRFVKDVFNGNISKFAKGKSSDKKLIPTISLTQEFKPTSLTNNKIINIKLAANRINNIIISPEQIFSFWKIVKRPTKKNGFVKGRNIIAGKLVTDYGGGLCQLSGMIYYISILAGLKTVERFNHTVDLYNEKTRYTPLGSDATVVFAYKDLRIENNFNFDVKFQVTVTDKFLKVDLLSENEIDHKKIDFKIEEETDDYKIVSTKSDNVLIAMSDYKKLKEEIDI